MGRYVLERTQLYAQNNPKRYAAVSCTIGGLLFGITLVVGPSRRHELMSWPAIVLMVVIGGGLWAGAMAVLMARFLRRMKPLPPDTDPARLRAARRLLRKGTLSTDPATNALAAQLADQLQAIPRMKKTAIAFFLCLTALNAFLAAQEIRDDNAGAAAFYGVGALIFLLVTIGQARSDRRHRNAAKLREDFGAGKF